MNKLEEISIQKENNKVMTASDAVSILLTEFGIYSLQSKISNIVDGLKPVQRRILLVHNTSENPKVITVSGKVIDQYHPHGDNAISDTITRMAQPFNTTIPLMISDSNVGDYGGGEAAASRYLKVGCSKFTQHIYFNKISFDVFEYMLTEIGNGKLEPKYLVPKIPAALLVASFGIGLGYRSAPANICMGELCDMVINYINMLKEYPRDTCRQEYYKKLAKYMIPDFPIKQLIRNKNTLLKEYIKGVCNTPLILDGYMEVYPNSIKIKTLPYMVKPKKVWLAIGKAINDKHSNFINSNFVRVTDHSKKLTECDIEVILKRGVSPFDVLDELKTFITFSKKWTPSYIYTNRNFQVVHTDPLGVIDAWYLARTRCIKAELSYGQHKYIAKIRLLEAQIKIGDEHKVALNLITDSENVEEAVPKLCKRFKLSKAQAYAFFDAAKLKDFLRRGHRDLKKLLTDTINELNMLQKKFVQTDKSIIEDVIEVRKKFPKYINRIANSPKFIGIIIFSNGAIQFESFKELRELAKRFNNIISICIYPSGSYKKYLMIKDKFIVEDNVDFPREFSCEKFGIIPYGCINSIVINYKDKTIFGIKGIGHIPPKDTRIFFIRENGTCVTKSGDVKNINFSKDLKNRKSLNSSGIKSDIIFACNTDKKDLIIAYSDTVNTIVLRRVKRGTRVVFQPLSIRKTYVHEIVEYGKPISISLPKEYIKKNSYINLIIDDTSFIDYKGIEIKMQGSMKGLPNSKRFNGIIHVNNK